MPFAPFFHHIDEPDHGRVFRVSDAGVLDVNVDPGRYRIDVTVHNFTVITTLTMTDGGTNFVFLSSGGTITSNFGGPYPADSIPLARVVTAGGDITSVTDDRAFFAVETGGGGGGGNTLNAAYDQGGGGAGRVITVDSGPVELQHSANIALLQIGSAANPFFQITRDGELSWHDGAGGGVDRVMQRTATGLSLDSGLEMSGQSVTGASFFATVDAGGTPSFLGRMEGNAPVFVPLIALQRARAGPAAVLSGDGLAILDLGGYDGTAFDHSVQIAALASENWAVGAHGSRLQINITPIGSVIPVNVWSILDTGELRATAAQTISTGAGDLTLNPAGAIVAASELVLSRSTLVIDANDEITVPQTSLVYLDPPGADVTSPLEGIGAGTVDGQIVFLTPLAGTDITLIHDGTVTAGKKMMINGEANVLLDEDHDTAIATWDVGSDVWNVIVPGAGGGGANHDILDGSVHQDSVVQGVTQGSIIFANATPRWDELVIGTARELLQVNAAGTLPEWASNIDIPGTLDVTGLATFDTWVGLQSPATANRFLNISPAGQTLSVSTNYIHINPASTIVDTSSIIVQGVFGQPIFTLAAGITGVTVAGLNFTAVVAGPATATVTEVVGLRVAAGSAFTDLTVTDIVLADLNQFVFLGSPTLVTITGVRIGELGHSTSTDVYCINVTTAPANGTNRYGFKMPDITGGTIARMIDVSAFQIRGSGEYTDVANGTPMGLNEGVTPTFRQVMSTDMAFLSITSDDTSTVSSVSFDVWDQDNYPGATLNTTDNIPTAKNISLDKTNGRFTVDEDGIYEITFTLLATSTAFVVVLVDIQDGGVSFYSHNWIVHASVDPTAQSVTVIRSLSATDFINVLVNGTSVIIEPGTTMSIRKIADITQDKVAIFSNAAF